MSLLGAIEGWVTGYDPDQIQADQTAADAGVAARNKANLDSGKWTQKQYDDAMANLGQSDTPDVAGAVATAAGEGALEGLNNDIAIVGNAAQSVTSWTFGSIFKLIPWQVWVIGPIVLFFYFGGGSLLKAMVSKKAKAIAS